MPGRAAGLTIATRWNTSIDRVEISIADTGTGIQEEHRSRVFDPFFTTKKVGEGTGLGLTVSYGIINQVTTAPSALETKTAEAEDPVNHGTIFTVTLPVFTVRSGKGRNGRETEMAETILIVDDEVEMLELLELIITDKTGYRVLTSSNSLEVLEILVREETVIC